MDRKSWLYIGHLKNSDWFRKLSTDDRAAVLAAAELESHESAVKVRAFLTFFYLVAIYVAAFFVWGRVFYASTFWTGLGGALVGGAVGLLSAATIASQPTPQGAKDMQVAASGTWGLLGLTIGAAGLLAWLVRYFLFG